MAPVAPIMAHVKIHDQFLRDCGGAGTLLGVF
jgi:hypothetical protein